MKNTCEIIRVDPQRRTIAKMAPRFGRNATSELLKITRAKRLGSREIQTVNGIAVVVAGGLDVDEEMQGWRLRGGEDTAGIGVLFGRVPGDGDGMVDCPVDVAWVRERIQWLDGEDVDGRADRAAELVHSLDDAMREAIANAIVVPSGDIWLSAADKAALGEAMQTLGLGTERSGGQMLTKLGEAVHDLLVFGESLAAEEASA